MKIHTLLTLTAVAMTLLSTHCAAQSDNLIPSNPSSAKHTDFIQIASKVDNPCAEESLSEYKTLADLSLAGKTCHDAYILSSEIDFFLSKDVSQKRTEEIVIAEAKHMAQPFQFITKDRPRLGKPDAPVEIVIFSDFECPFCARAAKTAHSIYEARPDSVSVVFKNYPLHTIHPYAAPAAIVAAYAHSQGKFWEVHDKLFNSQKDMGADLLIEILVSLGTDPEEVFNSEKGQKYGVVIIEDMKDAEMSNIAGTPTFYLNGVEIDSGAGYDRLLARVDAELNAPAVSVSTAKKAPVKTSSCPYAGLDEHYALLSDENRSTLSLLASSTLCPCPESAQTLHECGAVHTCDAATTLLDYIMVRLNEKTPHDELVKEIDAFVKNARSTP